MFVFLKMSPSVMYIITVFYFSVGGKSIDTLDSHAITSMEFVRYSVLVCYVVSVFLYEKFSSILDVLCH